jgi:two-component sensor histidine kinase
VTVITLAPETTSPAAARHFVRDFLADAGFGGSVVFPAVLATSELVTNAVLHAGTAVDLRIEIAGPKLRVEVVDYGGGCPVHERVSFDADHGHGLMVVARVATRWGVDLESDRKSVWFELPCPCLRTNRSRRARSGGLPLRLENVIRHLPGPWTA